MTERTLSNRALGVWMLAVLSLGFFACPQPTAPLTFHRHGLTTAQCMVHTPHWSTVVTYWADTTLTTVGHADTTCSITGPVQPPTIGSGGR